jgi:hypothetical protein
MHSCRTIEQGYPVIGDTCSKLANTGVNLGLLLALGVFLVVVGILVVKMTRA